MADAIQKAKLKSPYTDRLNPRYAANAGAEQKRKEAEAFEALNQFVRRHGGFVTTPPGRLLRIEVPRGSELPAKLAELGYNVAAHGTITRVTGAQPVSPKVERATRTVPSAFTEMNVIEITLSGK